MSVSEKALMQKYEAGMPAIMPRSQKDSRTPSEGRCLQHERWDRADEHCLGQTLGPVPPDVACDLAAARRGWLERPWPRRSWAMQRYPRDVKKSI
jgi:hypothetical protein